MKSCFICDAATASCVDVKKEVTNFTGRLVFDIISVISGSPSSIIDFICQVCLEKCNEFDEYSTKAEQIQRDFRLILQRKIQIKQEPKDYDYPYAAAADIFTPSTSFAISNICTMPEWNPVKQENSNFNFETNPVDEDFRLQGFDDDSASDDLNPINTEKKSTLKVKKSTSGKRGRPPKPKESHTTTEMFHCTEPGCERRFDCRAKLNFHVQYHSKVRNHQCQQCGKCFKTKSCLGSHRRAVHKDKRVICDTCGMNFSRKQGLLRHYQAAHLGLRPYVCAICGLAYNNSSSLKSHQFTHDPTNKTVVCEICSARFFNKSKLDRHKKSHGEKEYQCTICHRMFSQRYNLTAHMKTVHGIGAKELKASVQPASFICQLCGRVFDKQKTLQVHLRSVHEAIPLNASF